MLRPARFAGKSVGFVPTMGALHDGHASLIRASASQCDVTVVSIFVNPTQFGPYEDYDKYPRTLDADADIVEQAGGNIVFAPAVEEVYPEGKSEVQFTLKSMDQILCGAKRPGHFNGVMQVVTKLFNMVAPDKAFFGQKDFQQLAILRRLGQELWFNIDIIGCEIIREPDGLAMSSRNRYLSPAERQEALFLSRALKKVQEEAKSNPAADVRAMHDIVKEMLLHYALVRLDYFDIRRSSDLHALEVLHPEDQPRALIAAYCGDTRLIDNMPVFG